MHHQGLNIRIKFGESLLDSTEITAVFKIVFGWQLQS